MQLMNGFTVLIMTGVLHLLIAAAGLLIRAQPETRAIVRLWVLAQIIGGVSQLLRLMRGDWPDFWSSSLPNMGLSLSYGLALLAVIQLFRFRSRAFILSTVAVVVLQLVLRELGLPESTRLTWLSLLFALQFCQYVYIYGQAHRQHKTTLMNVLQLANLLVVMTILARATEAASAGANYDFQHAGLGQALALVGVFIAVTINGFGFLLMLIERGTFELTRLSTLDPLTETLNRRSFLDTAGQQLALAKRNLYPVSVLMCDIDHFKQFNDQHGHQAGDSVISALVTAARRTMRGGDCIARWGGEEFVLLLPYTQRMGAEQLAQRLNRAFAVSVITHAGKPLNATVSIGVAEHQANEDIQTTIDRADQAMFKAKQNGRNRVEVA